MQRRELRLQRDVEVLLELFAHLGNVQLEAVGGVEIDRVEVRERRQDLSMHFGHARGRFARPEYREDAVGHFASVS